MCGGHQMLVTISPVCDQQNAHVSWQGSQLIDVYIFGHFDDSFVYVIVLMARTSQAKQHTSLGHYQDTKTHQLDIVTEVRSQNSVAVQH